MGAAKGLLAGVAILVLACAADLVVEPARPTNAPPGGSSAGSDPTAPQP
jgi:hypothetical protein